MILLLGHVRVSARTSEKFRKAAATLVAATRKERGCLAYAFAEDINEPGLYHIVARWVDEAAALAHRKTRYLEEFRSALPTFGLSAAWMARYDAETEQTLTTGV